MIFAKMKKRSTRKRKLLRKRLGGYQVKKRPKRLRKRVNQSKSIFPKGCHCRAISPYVCRYCMNSKKAPTCLSILWRGVISAIDAKGPLLAERKLKTARRFSDRKSVV